MKCRVCATDMPENAARCPNCEVPIDTSMLTFSSSKSSLDRAFSASVVRARSESLLERADALDNFSDELEQQGLAKLEATELQNAITHIKDEHTASLEELENLLSVSEEQVALEGIKLSELLEGKGDDREILQRGLIFLKHRRYAEAVEWWSLNRQRLDATQQRLQFLLLIMEAFTHNLAGDTDNARKIRGRIKGHPLYEKYSTPRN